MATLKICVHSRTYWVTGVCEIEALRSFSTDVTQFPKAEGLKPDLLARQEREANDALMAAAFPPGSFVPPHGIRVIDWTGQPEGIWNVLIVKREAGDPTIWLTPSGSCFLMGDNGQTIDRI